MHLRKNGHSGSLSKVTKELQYANQNDTVPSQSFILFWLHNRLKLVIQGSHMVRGTRCPAWSDGKPMSCRTQGCISRRPEADLKTGWQNLVQKNRFEVWGAGLGPRGQI